MESRRRDSPTDVELCALPAAALGDDRRTRPTRPSCLCVTQVWQHDHRGMQPHLRPGTPSCSLQLAHLSANSANANATSRGHTSRWPCPVRVPRVASMGSVLPPPPPPPCLSYLMTPCTHTTSSSASPRASPVSRRSSSTPGRHGRAGRDPNESTSSYRQECGSAVLQACTHQERVCPPPPFAPSALHCRRQRAP